jgi:hypothetical protein
MLKLAAAGAVTALALAAPAGAGPPNPLPPQAAQQAVDAVATHASTEQQQAQQMTPAEMSALIGVPVGDLVGGGGPDRSLASVHRPARSVATVYCWSFTDAWTQWGIWPYQQRVTEYRYWCGYYGGAQTYRSSSVHPGSTLCSHDSGWQSRISGGDGYTYTVVRTGASFSCPTDIPWITIHTDRWQDWRANTQGYYWWVDAS